MEHNCTLIYCLLLWNASVGVSCLKNNLRRFNVYANSLELVFVLKQQSKQSQAPDQFHARIEKSIYILLWLGLKKSSQTWFGAFSKHPKKNRKLPFSFSLPLSALNISNKKNCSIFSAIMCKSLEDYTEFSI